MQRRLFLAILLLTCSTGALSAQTQPSAEPKSASGIPNSSTTAPATAPSSNPTPAPATPPAAEPSPAPAANPKATPQPGALPASPNSNPASPNSNPASPSSNSAAPASNSGSSNTTSSPSAAPSSTASPSPNASDKASDKSVASPSALPASPQQPKTEILDSSATSGAAGANGRDPILDPPPFPSGNATLVGGIIRDVDHVRNRMAVAVFGGGRWTVFFDERTHIFRNGAETTNVALKKGERVYVDT